MAMASVRSRIIKVRSFHRRVRLYLVLLRSFFLHPLDMVNKIWLNAYTGLALLAREDD